jgi:hypothetical protein
VSMFELEESHLGGESRIIALNLTVNTGVGRKKELESDTLGLIISFMNYE